MTLPVAAITVDAIDAQDAEAIARSLYGWPVDRVAVRHLIDATYHVSLYREPTDRGALVRSLHAAWARAQHARILGDHAGALIAAGDARRILAQLNAARSATTS